MHYRLVEANIKKDEKPIDEVLFMLQELKDAWETAIKKLKEEKPGTAQTPLKGGLNIAG